MRRIFKYNIPLMDRVLVSLPVGWEFLHLDEQKWEIMLWALVDENAEKKEQEFRVLGTGSPVPDDEDGVFITHYGTVLVDPFVWHVFAVHSWDDD